MSGDKKNPKNTEKEFSFIQEQIVPKKKNRFRKVMILILFTVILAVIFGFIASFVFYTSKPLFDKLLRDKTEEEIVTFPPNESLIENDEDETLDSQERKETKKKEKKEPVIIEKSLDADVSDYTHMYYEIGEVAKKTAHSIVTVTSVESAVDWFNNDYEITNVTSGLILKNSGSKLYILVSSNKIKETGIIRVTFEDNVTADANIQGCDSDLGIAILAVLKEDIPDRIWDNIKVATLGESILLTTGDPIIALGNPNGYMGSMEIGMVTNKPNSVYTVDNKIELFNTNINNNPNGEGVIVNMRGEVVGIVTQKFKQDLNATINTALSISKLKPVFESIINNTPRSYLGVIGADMTAEIAKGYGLTYGIYVTQVKPKSPAFKAGIKSGDVILSVGDMNIVSMSSLNSALLEYSPDETIKVTIKSTSRSDSKIEKVNVTLGTKK